MREQHLRRKRRWTMETGIRRGDQRDVANSLTSHQRAAQKQELVTLFFGEDTARYRPNGGTGQHDEDERSATRYFATGSTVSHRRQRSRAYTDQSAPEGAGKGCRRAHSPKPTAHVLQVIVGGTDYVCPEGET